MEKLHLLVIRNILFYTFIYHTCIHRHIHLYTFVFIYINKKNFFRCKNLGSTVTGRFILKAAAESNLKKVTLELGGKSPSIILADADLEDAVKWAHMGIFFNHGQCCTAGSRVYIEDSIYDKFLAKFKEFTKGIKIGDPFHSETYQGPQISQKQFDRYIFNVFLYFFPSFTRQQ